METFCRQLPKVEIHAHLNGCIPLRMVPTEVADRLAAQGTDIHSFFSLFKPIYANINTVEKVQQLTCGVIEDFARDGVVYLELRTTPRACLPDMDAEDYVRAVLSAIETCNSTSEIDIQSALLLSLDSRHSLAQCLDTVRLAIRLNSIMPGSIVGIDFCGDPKHSDVKSVLPALELAREYDLHITIHTAELPNSQSETDIILSNFIPDRIGHGTFLEERHWEVIRKNRIPIEICLTSNIACNTVPNLEDHHIQNCVTGNVPFSLCTDDSTIFNTTLSNEYFLASTHFGVDKERLFQLSRRTIPHIFAGEDVKRRLEDRFDLWWSKYCSVDSS